MRSVSIIGVGQTKFGAFPETSSKELFAEASKKSLESAGLTSKDIEAVYVGNFQDETFNTQGHIAPTMADYAGLAGKPATRYEAACASGGVAVRQAITAIAGGIHEEALETRRAA